MPLHIGKNKHTSSKLELQGTTLYTNFVPAEGVYVE